MFNFKKRPPHFSAILDQYARNSTKEVFVDETDKARIKTLLWNRIHPNLSQKITNPSPRLYYYKLAAASVLLFFIVHLSFTLRSKQDEKMLSAHFENTADNNGAEAVQ